MVVSIAYVGSHSSNLQYLTALNQITNTALLSSTDVKGCDGTYFGPSNPVVGTSASGNPCYRPFPAFGTLGGSIFDGIANYNSLQVVIEKRYSNGLSFNVNYAWSHFR